MHRILQRLGLAVLVACLASQPVALAEKPRAVQVNTVNVQSSRLETDRSDAASCTKAYVATKNPEQVACFAQSKVEANGLIQKPGKILCGDRTLNEPVAICTSHYKLKEQFLAKGVGKKICLVWIFGHFEHPTIKGGITISMREFDCAEMPTKDTWNGKLTRKWNLGVD